VILKSTITPELGKLEYLESIRETLRAQRYGTLALLRISQSNGLIEVPLALRSSQGAYTPLRKSYKIPQSSSRTLIQATVRDASRRTPTRLPHPGFELGCTDFRATPLATIRNEVADEHSEAVCRPQHAAPEVPRLSVDRLTAHRLIAR
jgi:hypothetical protein